MLNIKFRTQFLVLVAILLAVTVGFALFMLRTDSRITVSEITQQKSMVGEAMDYADMNFSGTFDDILLQNNATFWNDQAKAEFLNRQLAPLFESAAKLYPGLQIGIYDSELNVLLDGTTVYGSEALSAYRKGEITSSTSSGAILDFIVNRPAGMDVDGYRPLVRGGKTIGAIWVRAGVNSIYQREQSLQLGVELLILVSLLIGGAGSLLLFGNFVRSVSQVKDGVKRLSLNLAYRLSDAPGELGEIAASVNDLASQLTQSMRYNDIILACVVEGVLAVDSQGKVIGCNETARRLFALPEGAKEMRLTQLPAHEEGVNLLRQALTGGQLVHDLEIRKGQRVLLCTTGLLPGTGGDGPGALVTVRDITKRVRLEESSRRQERLATLGRFVAGIAHEIRNPLTSISGYTQYWQINPNPSPRALATIHREVTRLNTIVEKLLYFANPAQATYTSQDINALIPGVARFFRSTHPKRHIVENLKQGLPEVMIDQTQVEQVLMNLLYNAVNATGEDGVISLSTDCDGDYVVVSVADNGCGIDPKHLPCIFDPFFTTNKRGSGLGLAICHEIIQGHGGRITVDTTLALGSAFRIFLPLAGRYDNGTNTGC